MKFLNAEVVRTKQTPEATYGELVLYNENGELGRWFTIENTKYIIVEGEYVGKWTKSPRFSREATTKARKKDPNALEVEVYTMEVMGVLDGTRKRAGLRVHPVNFAKDLLGCVALGKKYLDLDKDGDLDLAISRVAIEEFNKACGGMKTMSFKFKNSFT